VSFKYQLCFCATHLTFHISLACAFTEIVLKTAFHWHNSRFIKYYVIRTYIRF